MKALTRLLLLLLVIVGAAAGWNWLGRHPQHNPFAPFDLAHPVGWATNSKLAAMVDTPESCHAALRAAGIGHRISPAIGSGECRLQDRTQIEAGSLRLSPNQPNSTCAVAAGLLLWQRTAVAPAAERHFGQRVATLEHLGTTNCRRIAGAQRLSEHASGNAFDISAFRLASGRRVDLVTGWQGKADEQAFLRDVRDGACRIFGTTLSPDFNAAHRDHFHFDMAQRDFGPICR